MAPAIAVGLKDLREFLENWRAVALALVLPAALVLIVGEFRTQPTTFRVLVAGDVSDVHSEAAILAGLLRESSLFDVVVEDGPIAEPLRTLQERRFDLLYSMDGNDRTAYSAVTDPFRAALLTRTMEQVRIALAKAKEAAQSRRAASSRLTEVATALTHAADVVMQAIAPTDFAADEARLSRAIGGWSSETSQLTGEAFAADRTLAEFVRQQAVRLQATVRVLIARRVNPGAIGASNQTPVLQDDAIGLLAAVESAPWPGRYARLEAPAIDLMRATDLLLAKLPPTRMLAVQSAGAQITLALSKVPAHLIETSWRRRMAALSNQVDALQRPSGSDTVQPRDPTALLREVRELASIAQQGGALAPAPSPPTLLDAMVAKVADPPLAFFYPLAAERPRALLPEIVALVTCFLPFVIAAQSLLREREARTAEILLAAPGITPPSLFAGKLGLPLLCGAFEFGLIAVLVQMVHHVYVKPGLLTMVLILLPAMGASALLGLATSAWSRSAAHATILTAIYFLVLTLFSGFLYPIAAQDPRALLALSTLSPLTFVHPAMKAWMFGAPVPFVRSMLGSSAQLVVYGAIAWVAYQRWLKSI